MFCGKHRVSPGGAKDGYNDVNVLHGLGEAAPTVPLRLQSGAPDALLSGQPGPVFNYVGIERYTCRLSAPLPATLRLAPGQNVLIANRDGTLFVCTSGAPWRLLSPCGFCFVEGPADIALVFSRDAHDLLVLAWNSEAALCLSRWLATLPDPADGSGLRLRSCHDPELGACLYALVESAERYCPGAEPEVMAIVHRVVARLALGPYSFSLTPLPGVVPDLISRLVADVRKDLAAEWTLAYASERVGYSPFYLSRVFKSLVGYGFPEFVERTRVEVAVGMLQDPRMTVGRVAVSAGFASSAALREALKRYVGFLPRELRRAPNGSGLDDEVIDFTTV